MVRTPDGGRGSLEQVAIATACLVVALLGYLLVPELDDALFPGMLAAVGALLGLGTYLVGRGHPYFAGFGRGYTWTYWVPPVVWFLASAALIRMATLGSGIGPAAVATLVLSVILLAQHREFQQSRGHRRGAEFVVSLAVFVSAFALFGVLYAERARGPVVAVGAALLAAVLASVPLRRAVADDGRMALYCGVIGVVVGQAAWALTYWTSAAIVGGAFLLLLFYVSVGLSEAVLDRSFSRRVLLEYSVVGACGLVLIVSAGPWQS